MPDAYTLDQTCAALQLTRPTVLKLIKEGRLRASKVGTKWLISHQAVREFLGDIDKVNLGENKC